MKTAKKSKEKKESPILNANSDADCCGSGNCGDERCTTEKAQVAHRCCCC